MMRGGALARRAAEGDSEWQAFRHVAWRAFLLVALSNVFSNWGAGPGELRLQLINVLSQIAFGYVMCYLIMRLALRVQVAVAVALLAGYWALFAAFPGPGGAWPQTCWGTTTPGMTRPST